MRVYVCDYMHDCRCMSVYMCAYFYSSQLGFNVHIQNKLLYNTPVNGTYSSYYRGCLSRTEG